LQSVRFRVMEEKEAVERLLNDFRDMTNLCLRVFRRKRIRTLRQAHQTLYRRLRLRYPSYNTAIIVRAYRVALQMRKHGARKVTKLSMRLSNLNSKFSGDTLRISVSRDVHLVVPLRITRYQRAFIDGWLRGEYTTREITIIPGFIIVPFEMAHSIPSDDKGIVAFDTNETNLTGITSSRKILKVDTGELKRLHDVYYRKRERIQGKINHELRLQRHVLKGLARREHNRVLDTMHKTAKKVAEECQGYHIVFEDLRDIRHSRVIYGKRLRRRLNSWNFAKLQELIDYKARLRGSTVEYVNPRNTTRWCSGCGKMIVRRLRSCGNCGLDRHVNAAQNILSRSLVYHRMWRDTGSAECSLMRLTPPNEPPGYGDVNERDKSGNHSSDSLTLLKYR
jgi:putative transposase